MYGIGELYVKQSEPESNKIKGGMFSVSRS
jgi:hypothetical protein